MKSEDLTALVTAGRLDEAVELALEHRVDWVQGQFSYEDMSEAAEAVEKFFARWLPRLPPFERLQAADWVAGQYILPMVHLDHSRGTAAHLLLGAQSAAAREMAQSLLAFASLTDGPDAEVDEAVSDRLGGYAEQLKAMSFESIPITPQASAHPSP